MRYYNLFLIIKYFNIFNVKNFILILKNIIIYNNCIIVRIEEWGVKNFSFKIKHDNLGYYLYFNLLLSIKIMNNLLYYLKFNKIVLRYFLFKLKKKDFNMSYFIAKKVFYKKFKNK